MNCTDQTSKLVLKNSDSYLNIKINGLLKTIPIIKHYIWKIKLDKFRGRTDTHSPSFRAGPRPPGLTTLTCALSPLLNLCLFPSVIWASIQDNFPSLPAILLRFLFFFFAVLLETRSLRYFLPRMYSLPWEVCCYWFLEFFFQHRSLVDWSPRKGVKFCRVPGEPGVLLSIMVKCLWPKPH